MTWLHWALLSALFAGMTAIFAKLGVANFDSHLATAIRTCVILVFAWAIAWSQGAIALGGITMRTWLFLVVSGLATGASWLCYFRAMQLGQASQVAPIDKLSVVVALALAAVFLGERLTPWQLLGGALIVAGSILVART